MFHRQVTAVVLAGALAATLLGCDGSGGSKADPGAALAALRASVPVRVHLPPPRAARGPSYPLATVRPGHTVDLRNAPGGRLLDRVGARTEFGSMRVLWIERIRHGWLGVAAPEMPNGRLAWIRKDPSALELSQTHFWITADVSRRRLTLRYGRRVLDSFPVSVGSPGSRTPPGDYAITDGLVGRGLGPWYGCCVLALSGHQPNLPAGWLGGNRMAIHGTPGAVGGADSHGCLRASDADMISLFARVPLGTPVFIRP
jgi:hypothetical protein